MLLVGCVCTPVSAQSYTKVISVKFERDSLLHVLQKINQLSGNCVNFRDEEVRKETKLITLEKKDVTVLQVVEEVLRGTNLVCVTQKENIIVVPKRNEETVKKMRTVKGIVKGHDRVVERNNDSDCDKQQRRVHVGCSPRCGVVGCFFCRL